MYVKVFSSILDSSLSDEEVLVRWVFVGFLALADCEGYVFGTRNALAARIRVSRGDLDLALSRLAAPDPNSSSQAEEGRRIVEVDGNRWFVVNYVHYRDIAKTEDRRRQNREAKRRERGKKPLNNTRCQHMSGCVIAGQTSDAEADADAEGSPPSPPEGGGDTVCDAKKLTEENDSTLVSKTQPPPPPPPPSPGEDVPAAPAPSPPSGLEPTGEEIQAFAYLVAKTGRTPAYELTEKRLRKLRQRIHDFGLDRFRLVVDKVASSPWHRGDNPNGHRYDGLDDAWCRSKEAMSKWLDKPTPKPEPKETPWQSTSTTPAGAVQSRKLPDGREIHERWDGKAWATIPAPPKPTVSAARMFRDQIQARSRASSGASPGGIEASSMPTARSGSCGAMASTVSSLAEAMDPNRSGSGLAAEGTARAAGIENTSRR